MVRLLLDQGTAVGSCRKPDNVTPARSIRSAFVVTVSFCAATLGDLVLEGISNSGLLWRGHYTDNSSLDLLPMCGLALLALLVTFCLLVREQVVGSFRALMYSMPRALRARVVVRLLPAIVALQLVTLFTMETVEQIVVYGKPLGGSLWLGAPTAVALLVHAIIGSAIAFGIALVLTRSADHVVRVVRITTAELVTPEAPRLLPDLGPRSSCGVDSLLRSARRSKRGPPTPAVLTT